MSRDDLWARLAKLTPARIALGRSGCGLPTHETLRFALAHAQARDAVHAPFDAMTLAHCLGIAPEPPPMGTVTVVESTLRPWPAVGKNKARKPRSRQPRA